MNGKAESMQLDAGSALAVISQYEFQLHFRDIKQNPSEVQLKTYIREKIIPAILIPLTST